MSGRDTNTPIGKPAVEDETADMEDVAAVDVDDIVRQKRLNSLFDSKKACKETRRKAQNLTTSEEGAEYEASSYYRHAIETYVRDAEALFSQSESGRAYWSTYDFGDFDVSPTVRQEQQPGDHGGTRQIVVKSDGTTHAVRGEIPTETISVRGLNSLFELPSPISSTFKLVVSSKRFGQRETTLTTTVEQQIPFQILDKMYAATNGYLAEIGLDVSVDLADSTAEGEYADIL